MTVTTGSTISSPPARPIRLAVVDDHEIVARGVTGLARERPTVLEVVLTTRAAADLLEALPRISVDVVLLDLQLNDGSQPVETIAALSEVGVKTLIYTSEMRPVPLQHVFRAGALGVCLKSDPDDCLVGALTEVATGTMAMSSDLAYVLATDIELAVHLAPRELQALELLASGVPKKAIGNRMEPPVAEATVTTYFSRVAARYAEVGRRVGNSFDVVREAHKDGHLDL